MVPIPQAVLNAFVTILSGGAPASARPAPAGSAFSDVMMQRLMATIDSPAASGAGAPDLLKTAARLAGIDPDQTGLVEKLRADLLSAIQLLRVELGTPSQPSATGALPSVPETAAAGPNRIRGEPPGIAPPLIGAGKTAGSLDRIAGGEPKEGGEAAVAPVPAAVIPTVDPDIQPLVPAGPVAAPPPGGYPVDGTGGSAQESGSIASAEGGSGADGASDVDPVVIERQLAVLQGMVAVLPPRELQAVAEVLARSLSAPAPAAVSGATDKGKSRPAEPPSGGDPARAVADGLPAGAGIGDDADAPTVARFVWVSVEPGADTGNASGVPGPAAKMAGDARIVAAGSTGAEPGPVPGVTPDQVPGGAIDPAMRVPVAGDAARSPVLAAPPVDALSEAPVPAVTSVASGAPVHPAQVIASSGTSTGTEAPVARQVARSALPPDAADGGSSRNGIRVVAVPARDGASPGAGEPAGSGRPSGAYRLPVQSPIAGVTMTVVQEPPRPSVPGVSADAEAMPSVPVRPEAQQAPATEVPVLADVVVVSRAEAPSGAPRSDAPRSVAPRSVAPRSDAPQTPPAESLPSRAEVANPDAPRSDAPRSVAPRSDAPRSDAPRSVAPRSDAPRSDAPRSDAPQTPPAESLPSRAEVANPDAPRSVAPRSVAPRSVAPRSVAPRSVAQSGPALVEGGIPSGLSAERVPGAIVARESATVEGYLPVEPRPAPAGPAATVARDAVDVPEPRVGRVAVRVPLRGQQAADTGRTARPAPAVVPSPRAADIPGPVVPGAVVLPAAARAAYAANSAPAVVGYQVAGGSSVAPAVPAVEFTSAGPIASAVSEPEPAMQATASSPTPSVPRTVQAIAGDSGTETARPAPGSALTAGTAETVEPFMPGFAAPEAPASILLARDGKTPSPQAPSPAPSASAPAAEAPVPVLNGPAPAVAAGVDRPDAGRPAAESSARPAGTQGEARGAVADSGGQAVNSRPAGTAGPEAVTEAARPHRGAAADGTGEGSGAAVPVKTARAAIAPAKAAGTDEGAVVAVAAGSPDGVTVNRASRQEASADGSPLSAQARAVLEAVAAEASRAARPGSAKVRELNLDLATPELGKVRVRLEMAPDGGVKVEFRTASVEGAQALKDGLPVLRSALDGVRVTVEVRTPATAADFGMGGWAGNGNDPRQAPRWFEAGNTLRGLPGAGETEVPAAVRSARPLGLVDLLA
jgi:hypothetical protein